jgi:methylenetetrahydrofolate dehydrogenase (NADP+)/methenyltetrahydrofolate cyclohydrolase
VEILLRHDISPEGLRTVVIGRSNVVGKPAQLLLLRQHATVTVCHRRTRDLPSEVRRAELLVVAAGSPGLVRGDMLQPGAIVVDCGINVVDGRIVGDVDAQTVTPVASALTPVPGGVGPLTNAILMEHLARAVTRLTAFR